MKKIIIILFVCLSGVVNSQSLFFEQNGDVESVIGCDTTATEVTIGTQTWMRKNLDVVRYNDNTGIPKVTDNTAWAALTTPAYCWYNNDSATYAATYGALYNWYAVNTGKLCPIGWHVPSDAEWNTLVTYLGDIDVAGGKLKEVGTIHWESPNTGANDTVCFTALPSKYRSIDGSFYTSNKCGRWWSTLEQYDMVWHWAVFYNLIIIQRTGIQKTHGISVRCIKD